MKIKPTMTATFIYIEKFGSLYHSDEIAVAHDFLYTPLPSGEIWIKSNRYVVESVQDFHEPGGIKRVIRVY